MKRLGFGVALVAIGLAVGLIAAELGLRLLVASGALGREHGFSVFIRSLHTEAVADSIYRKSEDPVLGLELIPNSQRGDIRVNSFGFRGPEVNLEPPPGTERVVFLGDSETFGAMLKEEDTIVGALEAELNRRAGAGSYQVLNFGFPGYNTVQERVRLQGALKLDPSIVVLYYVLNDAISHPNTFLMERTPLYRSHVYKLVRYVQQRRRLSANQIQHEKREVVDVLQRAHANNFGRMAKNIALIQQHLDERGIRFVVVVAPEVLGFDDFTQYPYAEVHRDLAALREWGIEVVDPLPVLASQGRDPREYWVTEEDCHKNGLANRLLAEPLAEQILSSWSPAARAGTRMRGGPLSNGDSHSGDRQ